MKKVTVRELGGTVWCVLNRERWINENFLSQVTQDEFGYLIDLITSAMARHLGSKIVNDPRFPVTPAPDE